jgi:hypothetical protein
MVSGLLYYFGYANLTPMGMITNTYLMIFLNGLVSTAGVWLTHTLQEALERVIIITTIYINKKKAL